MTRGLAVAILLASPVALAAPDTFGTGDGHTGLLNVANNQTMTVNRYASVTANIAVGETTINVDSAAGFNAADLVLVWQVGGYPAPMSGAAGPFDLSASAAGHFELARVMSVDAMNNKLTFAAGFQTAYTRDVTQVVLVPEYASVTLGTSASITAMPWDGKKGGVVAFMVKGTLTMGTSASIKADGAGFRGGTFANGNNMTGCMGLDEAAPAGEPKGEGVSVGMVPTGRGNVANAGGGGVCLGSGGGGGGNGGAGGQGGRANDGARPVGGIGGGAIKLSLVDHLVFGGGGGAGHGSQGMATNGGSGGGVIFIRGGTLAGTGTISANGPNAPGTSGEAAGGGGAGGSIYLRFTGNATCTTINASGGIGGNAGADFGPGGGGSGGHVLFQAASLNTCPVKVTGGFAGSQPNNMAQDGFNFGALPGAGGVNETPPMGPYCVTDMDCGNGATPACQPGGFCGECSMSNKVRCTGMKPACDIGKGLCRGCTSDADCGPQAPACQPNGSCGQCSMTNKSQCVGQKPICDVPNGSCTGCTMDAQCKALDPTKPVCQTDNNAGMMGACGQCSMNDTSQCMGTTPICDARQWSCQKCTADAQCKALDPMRPACLGSGACGQCSMSEKSLCVGPTPTCNTTLNVCVLCVPGVDSTACAGNADGTSCQAGMNNAVFCGCSVDADCGGPTSGRVCDAASHKCIDGCSTAQGRNGCPMGQNCTDRNGGVGMCSKTCVVDADCAGAPATPYCLKTASPSRCVACLSDADCKDPNKKVCNDMNVCVQCSTKNTSACDKNGPGAACLVDKCGCNADADCGDPKSGRICDAMKMSCVKGCRGAGGNGCSDVEKCSSTDNNPGTCTESVPVPDGGSRDLYGGFGCATAPGASGSRGGLIALLGFAALLLVRRRRAGRLLAIALLVAASGSARADNGNSFQLNRYEPTAAGSWTFAVENPWYSATRYFAAGLTLNYGHKPLSYGVRDASGNITGVQTVIENQLLGHLDLAGSFLDRITITASLPVTLFESGNNVEGISPAAAGVGDPRFGVHGRIVGQPGSDVFSLSLGANLWVPVNAAERHAGDAAVRFLGRVMLAGARGGFRWSATAGFLYRPDAFIGAARYLSNHAGSELQFGAAFGYGGKDGRFHIGPEIFTGTVATGPKAFTLDASSIEVLLGGNYLIKNMIMVGAAVGTGLLREAGTPDFRGLLRVAWAPIRPAGPSDRDGDGIVDPSDACPDVKGVETSDPKTNGCPPPPPPPVEKDADQDGVPDEVDNCPMQPQGAHPDPARKGCPAADTDGDGFFDFQDQCPETPAGAHPDPKRQGCPAIDTDGDGVFDPDDQCPLVPMGLHPDPARLGCPAPDKDGDSVPDSADACPEKPGAPDPDPKKNGCPGLVTVKNGVIIILEPVFFATNKDVILPKSFPVLKAVANAMKAQAVIKLVAIEGHTDNKGKLEKNMDLSDRRAKSVLKFLVKEGVEETRLTAQGFGPKRPIATNSTEAGRAQNRRVEFHIVDPPVNNTPGATTPLPVKSN